MYKYSTLSIIMAKHLELLFHMEWPKFNSFNEVVAYHHRQENNYNLPKQSVGFSVVRPSKNSNEQPLEQEGQIKRKTVCGALINNNYIFCTCMLLMLIPCR